MTDGVPSGKWRPDRPDLDRELPKPARDRLAELVTETLELAGTLDYGVLPCLRLSSGERWWEVATGWQREDALAILQNHGPRMHFLTRPRGASKTTDLAGIALVVLLQQMPARSRGYGWASDDEQIGRLIDQMASFVMYTDMADLVKVDTRKATNLATEATLEIQAFDAAGSYGLIAEFLICDEVAQWEMTPKRHRLWEAIISTPPKRKGCRLVLLTSAGDPAHFSGHLIAKVRTSPRWRVHEVPGPAPWTDPADLEDQRLLLSESQYARLWLNRWTAAEDRLVRPDDLAACVVLDGPVPERDGVAYVAGLDVGITRDRTVLAVCHVEPHDPGSRRDLGPERRPGPLRGARVVLDRLLVWQGTSARPVSFADIEAAIMEVHGRYRLSELVFDPYQAVGLAQRVARAGVNAREFVFTNASVGRLALTLHTLLRSRTLALPDDEGLLDELEHVRLREQSPNVYRMDHDADRHDDRATALALAAQCLVERWQGSGPAMTGRLDATVTMDERRRADFEARKRGKKKAGRLFESGILGRFG